MKAYQDLALEMSSAALPKPKPSCRSREGIIPHDFGVNSEWWKAHTRYVPISVYLYLGIIIFCIIVFFFFFFTPTLIPLQNQAALG